MKKFGFATVVASGLAAAVLGFAGPAVAAPSRPGTPARVSQTSSFASQGHRRPHTSFAGPSMSPSGMDNLPRAPSPATRADNLLTHVADRRVRRRGIGRLE